ncbi:MAG TPA: hypothetical protein VE778_00250 [Candidatus Bathyarchaeia archaeon]|nr:hypothetical protein [Candidatus Bathyarchaeia archaeon]
MCSPVLPVLDRAPSGDLLPPRRRLDLVAAEGQFALAMVLHGGDALEQLSENVSVGHRGFLSSYGIAELKTGAAKDKEGGSFAVLTAL